MSESDIANSTAPEANVVVRASAGTGKTWLLVARIIRLLLAGVAPGAILAITFTRKAAAEIDARVSEELLALAAADDDTLGARLQTFGLGPQIDPATLQKARHLFEAVLGTESALRATTFHAFCADLLRRCPLEAGVPAGFDLIERTGELENEAWNALGRDARRDPEGELARDFDFLLRDGGLTTVREALTDFLQHRSDWWAYTEDREDPRAYAAQRLRDLLAIDPDKDPAAEFCAGIGLGERLGHYADLIERHDTVTNRTRATHLRAAHDCLAQAPQQALARLFDAFLNTRGEINPLKVTQVLEKRLGAGPLRELVELDFWLTDRLAAARETALRHRTYGLSTAWYRCGQRLLDHYQRLKEEQRLLDFGDLEWKTYRLLNHGRHAEWVQYKLDQRIDHLLVDEFQDTNPTQWRLLLPLLQEIAAGSDRARSVFLVGDEKQSIYRFRRADARLFAAARTWLEAHMPTAVFAQHISRRSSPAIIRFVNLVFAADQGEGRDRLLPGYDTHDTHLRELWGVVEILPLIVQTPRTESTGHSTMRNPLEHPRVVVTDERHEREGALIAARITTLIGRPISTGGQTRPLNYGDIIILLRDRTHALAYEQALRRAGIPYVGAGRGALLETLEVRDMLHLVRFLTAPQDNLAFASILRSPIFNCTDDDLAGLAQEARAAALPACWFERLQAVDNSGDLSPPLARATRLLASWREAVDRVPVHDLLDRIYNEGNVIARYVSAAPAHLKSRFEANLNRFLELALEVDSGRFPSLARFHASLEAVRGNPNEAPQEPPSGSVARVRIMTIHAVKGLEAPAVFLADAARDPHSDRGLRALIHWPVESPCPQRFQIAALKADQDSLTRQAIASEASSCAREDANLLYVALTRAKQILVISGCQTSRGSNGWYAVIEKRVRATAPEPGLEIETATDADGAARFGARLSFGTLPALRTGASATVAQAASIDPALTRPLPIAVPQNTIAPSRSAEAAQPRRPDYRGGDDADAMHRGTALHRMLQCLGDQTPRAASGRDTIRETLRRELVAELGTEVFAHYWDEACAVVDAPALRPWFDATQYDEARNEAAILYRANDQEIYGIIDRLVLTRNEAIVIDYKTHVGATAENAARLALQYTPQLRLYAAGVARLWPSKHTRAVVVFTAACSIVEISLNSRV